jgi:hypothetical protein
MGEKRGELLLDTRSPPITPISTGKIHAKLKYCPKSCKRWQSLLTKFEISPRKKKEANK